MYQSICLTLSLKSCKEDAFRLSVGKSHSLGAEYEKDLSNIDVLYIYSGVRLVNALYVKTALSYVNRSRIESHPNSWNMSSDGVLYSAFSIIRAARFFSFDSLT